MDSFIYTPSVKNSAPKPLYTDSEENENEHELALPIITKSEPFSSCSENVRYFSLCDTAM